MTPECDAAPDTDGRPTRRVDHRPRVDSTTDTVVLIDARGRPCGTAGKLDVHGTHTPLHLAFSCYLVDDAGRVLLTRRADSKRMFPGIWTNACCGHPRPGEDVEAAVHRHVRDELGVSLRELTCVLPDFAYRAEMSNGLVEHEVCPVYVASIDGVLDPNPLEVAAVEWTTWDELVRRAIDAPSTLSPWSVAQIDRLGASAGGLRSMIRRGARPPRPGPVGPAVDPLDPVRHIDGTLLAFIDDRAAELDRCDPLAGELTDRIAALVRSGGKRIRPAFVHWGATAGGQVGEGDVRAVAAAVEMLHTFAIIHDDVMDRSEQRRSRPTLHMEFGRMRRCDRIERPDPRFGESAAILAGDLAFAWSHELLDGVEADASTRRRVRRIFSTLCSEAVVGQYMDVRLTGTRPTDRQAVNIAMLKSARYSVSRPLELGATLAGADADAHRRLRAYGDAAGVAFQLRDDVLGVFGDTGLLGKSNADDIREGKASVLLVRAFELACRAGRDVLVEHVGRGDLDDTSAVRCREVIADSGALASVERLIEDRVATAHGWAQTFDGPTAGALTAMSNALTQRVG